MTRLLFRGRPALPIGWRRVLGSLFSLAACALVIPACGRTTPSQTPVFAPLSLSVATPVGTQSGIIPLQYTLVDSSNTATTITVEFSTNGGTSFQPATGAPGGEGTTGLATSGPPGIGHVFEWNSVADGVGLAAVAHGILVRITPQNTVLGSPVLTAVFTVDNTAHTPPSATVVAPAGTQSGLVSIGYSLVDAQSDFCTIAVSFSVDGGTTFAPATPGPGGDGIAGLASSPGAGTAHAFLWNSVADAVALSGLVSQVEIRLQPFDGLLGAAATTPNFSVNNTGLSSSTSFGGSYPVQVNSTPKSDWATATASDGVSLYTAGFERFDFAATSGADSTWRLEKRTLATGALVALFGVGGAVSSNPGPGLDVPFKVIVDGAFLFVIGAQESALGSRSFTLRVEKRRASDGSPVATFGSGGVLTGPAVGQLDGIPVPWTAAVDGSFLYVAGTAPVTATDLEWRIEKRDKLSGALIPGFGTAGVVEENPTAAVDGCFGMVIDSSSMWLVGSDSLDPALASDGRLRLEKRLLADGSLVTAFGGTGVISSNPGPGDDIGEDVVSDGTSLYLYARVETASSSGLFSSRLEKRSLQDGSLTLTVTGAGSDPTGALPFHHLALTGGTLFVCAGDGSAGVSSWRLEKRQTSDLSLVSTFGASGVLLITPVAGAYHRPLDLVSAGGVIFVAGMSSSSAGDDRWRIEARWR